MGEFPDVAGLRVLDFGCGHGALSVQLAQAGADVTGVDLDEERIRYAVGRVARDWPELVERIRFTAVDIAELGPDGQFDAVFTKDTFEHVADLDAVLADLRRLLTPGGRLYVGFGPLYHSPNGDHGYTGLRAPWAHALLPQRWVLAQAARHKGRPVRSLDDLGLNGLTAPEFMAAFDRHGFDTSRLRTNVGRHPALRILSVLRRVGPLERFATVSIYGELVAAGRAKGPDQRSDLGLSVG